MPKYLYYTIILFCFLCHNLLSQLDPTPVQYVIGSDSDFNEKYKGLYISAENRLWVWSDHILYLYRNQLLEPILTLDSVNISCVMLHNDQSIYLGTVEGQIFEYRDGVTKLWEVKEAHAQVPVSKMLSIYGSIFISTYGEGLFRYKDRRLTHIGYADGLLSDEIYDMELRSDGLISIITDLGLQCIDLSVEKHPFMRSLTGNPDVLSEFITTLNSVESGHYACNINGEIFENRNSSATWEKIDTLNTPADKMVFCQDRFYYLTKKRVLQKSLYDATSTLLLDVSEIDSPVDLAIDHYDKLWILDSKKGLFYTDLSVQHYISDKLNNAQAIVSDRSYFYIGTSDYLLKISKTSGIITELISKINTTSLYLDKRNTLWVGTFGEGLFYIKEGEITHYNEPDGLLNNNILSIKGIDDRVVLSTLNGIQEIELDDVGSVQSYRQHQSQNGLATVFNYDVELSVKKGKIWVATDGHGVDVISTSGVANMDSINGAKIQSVYSLEKYSEDEVIALSANQGIVLCGYDSCRSLISNQQMPSGEKSSLLYDQKRDLLCLISEEAVYAAVTRSDTTFSLLYKWNSKSFLPSLNAAELTVDQLIIAGAGGLMVIEKPYDRYKQVSKIVLHDIKIDGVSQKVHASPYFFAGNSEVTFLLDHDHNVDIDGLGFRYRLLPHDRVWHESRTGDINFHQLSAGDYQFEAELGFGDPFVRLDDFNYSFGINPKIYNRPLFWLAATALGFLIFYLLQRSKSRQKHRESELEKQRVVAEYNALKSQINPHFLFNCFNTLSGLIEEDQERAADFLHYLSDFFRSMLLFRNVDKYNILQELDLVRNYSRILKERYGDDVRIQISSYTNYGCIVPLTLIILIENAVKHNKIGANNPLTIEININAEKLIVRNKLTRKNVQESSTGYGLEHISKRYALILGKDEVIVEDGNADFVIHIPVLNCD